jgi:hypothetical protein
MAQLRNLELDTRTLDAIGYPRSCQPIPIFWRA